MNPPPEDFQFSNKDLQEWVLIQPAGTRGENSGILKWRAEFIGKQSKKAAWPSKKEALIYFETSGTTN
jgi:hypothetical protein